MWQPELSKDYYINSDVFFRLLLEYNIQSYTNKLWRKYTYKIYITPNYLCDPIAYQLENVGIQEVLDSIITNLNIKKNELKFNSHVIANLNNLIQDVEKFAKSKDIPLNHHNTICNCCEQKIKGEPILDRWGGYICVACNQQENQLD